MMSLYCDGGCVVNWAEDSFSPCLRFYWLATGALLSQILLYWSLSDCLPLSQSRDPSWFPGQARWVSSFSSESLTLSNWSPESNLLYEALHPLRSLKRNDWHLLWSFMSANLSLELGTAWSYYPCFPRVVSGLALNFPATFWLVIRSLPLGQSHF